MAILLPTPEHFHAPSAWIAPRPVVSGSSAGPLGLEVNDPAARVWLAEMVSASVTIPPAPAQKLARWTAHKHLSVSSTFVPRDNESSTYSEYRSFDDVSPILLGPGLSNPRLGPVGYWVPLDAGQAVVNGFGVSDIVSKLSQLPVGWNGEGTLAPSENVKADIVQAFSACPISAREPDLEVDDDGSVALLWDDDRRSFALTFLGNGKVMGTLSPRQSDYEPWSARVDDYAKIVDRFGATQVVSLLA